MSVSLFDQLFKANSPFFFIEPMLEINKMAIRFYGEAAKEQTKAMNELIRCHMEQCQQLNHAKRWQDMMAIQTNWVTNVSSPINEYMQYMINSYREVTSNTLKWFEKSSQKEYMNESLEETDLEESATLHQK